MKHLQTCPGNHQPARQQGAALIIGLVLLISLTVIGISVLSTTSLEQRMAGNMTEMNLAFNAAETGSQAIALAIAQVAGEPDFLCQSIGESRSRCNPSFAANWWDTADDTWWDNNSIDLGTNVLTGARAVSGVQRQPQIVIQIDPNSDLTKDTIITLTAL